MKGDWITIVSWDWTALNLLRPNAGEDDGEKDYSLAQLSWPTLNSAEKGRFFNKPIFGPFFVRSDPQSNFLELVALLTNLKVLWRPVKQNLLYEKRAQ